ELLPQAIARLVAGDRGDAQVGGEYFSHFEPEYERLDLGRSAADVERQVRAWAFLPPNAKTCPVPERHGTRIRIVAASLTEVAGAERIECADGPLWITASVPL